MKWLWAPWRYPYIRKTRKTKNLECIFCKAVKSTNTKKHHVIYRNLHCFAILNRFPYNNGHVMVAPNRHLDTLSRLTEEEEVDIFRTLIDIKKTLTATLKPQGFNIGINIGDVAGAGIADHFHIHVVPRWKGDTNFMPVLGATKVISQSLDDLYEKLSHAAKGRVRRTRG